MTLFSLRKKIFRRLLKLAPTSSIRVMILRASGYLISKKCSIASGFFISDRSVDKANVIIGDRVEIAQGVRIITTSGPIFSKLSFFYNIVYEKVVIEDDVWIGTGAIILHNVTIGKCSIIGAGTIVDKDVPEYSYAKGNPMKIRRMNQYLIKTIESGSK
jgi:acetyltransferase-like isoleucine patch superfamily enzyme